MHAVNLDLPFFTNPLFAFGVFIISLLIAHAVLLPLLGIKELWWHYLDYLWLPMALLGVIAATQQNKVEVANNIFKYWKNYEEFNFKDLNRFAARHSRDDSYLCIKGVRGQYSPPPEIFDAMNNDTELICNWFKTLEQKLKSSDGKVDSFEPEKLPAPPILSGHSGTGPRDAIEYYNDSINQIVAARSGMRQITDEMGNSPFSKDLKYIGPFIICVALAIRITKVTGEARIKKLKTSAK